MILHGVVSSRTFHLTVAIINLILTLHVDPWCWVEVPYQISPIMSESFYIFRQGDLPKLDLQIDCGSDFFNPANMMGIVHEPVQT